MKKIFKDNNLYIVLPSKVEEEKFIQNPQDVTIVNKTEDNCYLDFLTNEEIYVFNRDELSNNKKYIGVFNGDLTMMRNYIFSLKTDHIKNTDNYMELIRSVDSEYEKSTLEKIIYFLKEEIQNLEYTKTRKITRGRRKIRKK